MKKYTDAFTILHDEPGYTVLRAVMQQPALTWLHDFAVIWDEDHDERVIWVAEQLYVRGMLPCVLSIGERKANVTVTVGVSCDASYVQRVDDICENVPSDAFTASVEPASHLARVPHVEDHDGHCEHDLRAIDARWKLGRKSLPFSTEPFEPLEAESCSQVFARPQGAETLSKARADTTWTQDAVVEEVRKVLTSILNDEHETFDNHYAAWRGARNWGFEMAREGLRIELKTPTGA